MITSGFTYVAVLVFLSALMVGLQEKTKSKFFLYVPPVVALYLLCMVLCTFGVWDLESTYSTYASIKNPVLFSMIFLMLLGCDVRKIMKLGPRMIGGFLAASITISLGFVVTYAVMAPVLGPEAWRSLAALCGTWMGGSGNLMAIQSALGVSEDELIYALVMDSINYSLWVMFLLWAVQLAPQFNKWVKADTSKLEEVSKNLAEFAKENKKEITFPPLLFLLGFSMIMGALSASMGVYLGGMFTFLDGTTWTVMILTTLGLIFALTPVGTMAGATELSSVMMYVVIGLLASRASLLELTNGPAWIIAGFGILLVHGVLMVIIAKIFRLDMFTCGVASLANIGGTASAPVLASTYSGSLIPVGVLMALMGYVVGTFGGLITAHLMSLFAR